MDGAVCCAVCQNALEGAGNGADGRPSAANKPQNGAFSREAGSQIQRRIQRRVVGEKLAVMRAFHDQAQRVRHAPCVAELCFRAAERAVRDRAVMAEGRLEFPEPIGIHTVVTPLLLFNHRAVRQTLGVVHRLLQQRVAVARAIAAQPPIILADEPTGNLDSKSTIEIMNILKDLHESGRTVIIITHNQALAPMADRLIHIKNGQVVRMESNENPTSIDEIEW